MDTPMDGGEGMTSKRFWDWFIIPGGVWIALLFAVPLTGAAPQPDQIPQPDRTPPTSADPEALAFEAALAAGTAPALWTFLKAYPQGEYIAQARAALQSLLQPPPAAPTAPPSPGKGG